MSKVMITVASDSGSPSLQEICERYSLSPAEVDQDFGVIEVDERDHTYTILVEEQAARRIKSEQGGHVGGPYSNPRIAHFGPPQS